LLDILSSDRAQDADLKKQILEEWIRRVEEGR
jgi:hypothetical protein